MTFHGCLCSIFGMPKGQKYSTACTISHWSASLCMPAYAFTLVLDIATMGWLRRFDMRYLARHNKDHNSGIKEEDRAKPGPGTAAEQSALRPRVC